MRIDDDQNYVPPGYRVGGTAYERRQQVNVRRLARDVYWVEALGAQATVVAKAGQALLIDPHQAARTDAILEAISAVCDAPVTAVAYSHHHADHIGGIDRVAALHERPAQELRILATERCAREVARRGMVREPNEILPDAGTFSFGGTEIAFGTLGGHSADNTFFLVDDVIHCVDTVHPGQLEYEFFGVGSIFDYQDALVRLHEMNWRVMTAGHGDIGWPADVSLVLRYLTELSDLIEEEAGKTPLDPFVDPQSSGYSWNQRRRNEVARAVVEKLRPAWGQFVGFDEYAQSHAWAMYQHLIVLREPAVRF